MKTPTLPFRALAMLLYGDFDWMERKLPLIVVPTTAACRQLKTTPKYLRSSFDWLESHGIISFDWHDRYATVHVTPPPGMVILLQDDVHYIVEGKENG